MSRIKILLILLIVGCNKVVAQYTIDIQGNKFDIEINQLDRTATICDYNYKVVDTKYNGSKPRKIRFLGKEETRTLFVPEIFKGPNGEAYTITTIGKAAFAGFKNIDYLVLPNTITNIEEYAFFNSSILSINIPPSVSIIGDRAFGRCNNLKSLKLPQDIIIGKDLYAESKEISVKYYAPSVPSVPAASNASTPARTEQSQKAIALSSDVDRDLPIANSQNEELFAIVIANENYQKVAKVDCALNDGRTFQRYCQQTLGIPSDNIHMVEDATYGQMKEEFNWLTRVAKVYEGEARVIVYYAGHGIPDEKNRTAFLLPVDVSGDNAVAAFSLKELYEQLGALNVKNVTLFMDACFSGSQRGEGMLTSARAVAIETQTEDPLGNMIVFSAAQGDETAYPYLEKGHGLFTYFLLKKLKETKGNVDYGTLSDYIRKEVGRKSIVVNKKPQPPTVTFSPKMRSGWRNFKLR